MSDFNAGVIDEFRTNGGRVVHNGRFGRSLVLLHSTGARSGEPRLHPVFALRDPAPIPDQGAPQEPRGWVVAASKAGAPSDPAWAHNLRAHPGVRVEHPDAEEASGIRTLDATAHELDGDAYDEAWARLVATAPMFADYATKTDRRIPLFHLAPIVPPAPRHPLPPFTAETAAQKVQAAEDAWNTRDPQRVAGAYTVDTVWRNRDEHVEGREAVVAFLTRKWERELDYRLRKNLWAFAGNRIAVRFQYEWHDAAGQWWRSYGNENWEFDDLGFMRRREASINDVAISADERRVTPGEGELPVF